MTRPAGCCTLGASEDDDAPAVLGTAHTNAIMPAAIAAANFEKRRVFDIFGLPTGGQIRSKRMPQESHKVSR